MASALISKSLVLVALVGVLQGTSASGPGAHGARDNHSKLHLDVELDAPVVRKSKLDAETELLKEATHDLALGNVNTDVFKNFANYQEDETILVFMDDEETEHALLDENLLIGAEEEIEYDNDLIAEVPKDAEDWLQKADAWSLDTNNWLVDDPKQSGHGASKVLFLDLQSSNIVNIALLFALVSQTTVQVFFFPTISANRTVVPVVFTIRFSCLFWLQSTINDFPFADTHDEGGSSRQG